MFVYGMELQIVPAVTEERHIATRHEHKLSRCRKAFPRGAPILKAQECPVLQDLSPACFRLGCHVLRMRTSVVVTILSHSEVGTSIGHVVTCLTTNQTSGNVPWPYLDAPHLSPQPPPIAIRGHDTLQHQGGWWKTGAIPECLRVSLIVRRPGYSSDRYPNDARKGSTTRLFGSATISRSMTLAAMQSGLPKEIFLRDFGMSYLGQLRLYKGKLKLAVGTLFPSSRCVNGLSNSSFRTFCHSAR